MPLSDKLWRMRFDPEPEQSTPGGATGGVSLGAAGATDNGQVSAMGGSQSITGGAFAGTHGGLSGGTEKSCRWPQVRLGCLVVKQRAG